MSHLFFTLPHSGKRKNSHKTNKSICLVVLLSHGCLFGDFLLFSGYLLLVCLIFEIKNGLVTLIVLSNDELLNHNYRISCGNEFQPVIPDIIMRLCEL